MSKYKKKSPREIAINKIKDICQASVPGYWSARMALTDLRPFNTQLSDKEGELWTLECVLYCDYITARKDDKRGWFSFNGLEIEEIELIASLCQLAKKVDDINPGERIRAINPFWFIGKEANDNLDAILNESREEYLAKIKKNGRKGN